MTDLLLGTKLDRQRQDFVQTICHGGIVGNGLEAIQVLYLRPYDLVPMNI